jgi:hypothetical protein
MLGLRSDLHVSAKWDASWLERLTAYKALPDNDMGGSLHIYIEDGNCQRHDLVYCRQWAIDHGDAVGSELAADLLNLTKGQRHHLYRKMWGR